MLQRLREILELQPGEGVTFGCLFAYLFFFGAAAAIGGSVAESIFMHRLGAAALPLFFIAADLSVTVLSVLYTRLGRRLGGIGSFRLILGGNIAVALLMKIVMSRSAASRASLAAPLLLYWTWYVFLQLGFLHFSRYQRRCFDIQQGKRLLPRLLAGTNVGVVAGGVAAVVLLQRVSTYDMIGVWTMVLGLAFLAIELAGAAHPLDELEESRTVEKEPEPTLGIGEHRLARWIFGFAAISYFTMRLFEFEASLTLARAFQSDDSLTAFYAGFGAVARVLSVFIQLALLPRAIARFGLPGAALLFPAFACAAAFALNLTPGLLAAVAARFAHNALIFTISDPVVTLLTGALPPALAEASLVLTSGFIVPITSVAVSLMLVLASWSGWSSLLPPVAFLASGLLAWHAVRLRSVYATAVLDLVKGRSVREDSLELLDVSTLPNTFYERLETGLQSDDPAVAGLTIDLLARCSDPRARRQMLRLLDRAVDVALKARVLHGLRVGRTFRDEERAIVQAGLRSRDRAVLAAAVSALGRMPGSELDATLPTYLDHPEPLVRLSAAAYCADAGREREKAGRILLDALLDARTTEAALAVLRHVDPGPMLEPLRRLLEGHPALREKTLTLLADCEPGDDPSKLEVYRSAALDPSPRVRVLAAGILGHFRAPEAGDLLLRLAFDPCRPVAEKAIEQLSRPGVLDPARLAEACELAGLPDRGLHALLDVSARLGRSELAERLGAREIRSAYQLSCAAAGVSRVSRDCASARVLRDAIAERVKAATLLGVHAVCALRQPEAFESLGRKLFGPTARERAEALEAFLELREKSLTTRLLPLVEGGPAAISAAAHERFGFTADSAGAVGKLLRDDGGPVLLSLWLCVARENGWRDVLYEASTCASHPHRLVRETYNWALAC